MKRFKTSDGNYVKRVSRWIRVKENCSPNRGNSLWCYVHDDAGYHPHENKFNPENGLFLDYFRYGGRTYAVDQFYRLGSFFVSKPPIVYCEHGDLHYNGSVDMDGDMFNPLYGEWEEDADGVRVRLYLEEEGGKT